MELEWLSTFPVSRFHMMFHFYFLWFSICCQLCVADLDCNHDLSPLLLTSNMIATMTSPLLLTSNMNTLHSCCSRARHFKPGEDKLKISNSVTRTNWCGLGKTDETNLAWEIHSECLINAFYRLRLACLLLQHVKELLELAPSTTVT